MDGIDFKPLDVNGDMRVEKSDPSAPKYTPVAGSIFVGIFGFLPLLFVSVLIGGAIGGGVFLVGLVALAWFIKKHVYGSSHYYARLANFAMANGFSYEIGPLAAPGFGSALGHDVANRKISCKVGGEIHGRPFSFYNFLGLTVKGFYSVFEVELEQQYPHILMDGQANKELAVDIKGVFGDQAAKKVEHQFEKHFTVYSTVDPTLTLQVVEPSLMQSLLENSMTLDVELVGDRLYIISRLDYPDSKRMKTIFGAAESILANLDAAPIQ